MLEIGGDGIIQVSSFSRAIEDRNMTTFTLPMEIGSQLGAAHQCVVLRDGSGKTIGYFTPVASDAQLDPQISEEELDRREREDRTFTPAEVRARLQSL